MTVYSRTYAQLSGLKAVSAAALSRQGSLFQQDSFKPDGFKDMSRFARFEGPNPARRGSMFGQTDHESWGYEPFSAAEAQAAMRRRESMRFEEPARNSSFLGSAEVVRGISSGCTCPTHMIAPCMCALTCAQSCFCVPRPSVT